MAEFIVVGAGVYGAGIAWFLAQRGASVLVLDERDVATRASGGPGRRGVRANGRDVRELPLMERAYEVWPDLHQRLASSAYKRVRVGVGRPPSGWDPANYVLDQVNGMLVNGLPAWS